jgi:hypothetical protein
LQLINYECCQNIFYHNDQLYFEYDEENNLVLSIDKERPCESCGNVNVTKKFSNTPLWLIIQNLITTYQQKKLKVFDLPTEIVIDGVKFRLLMCTYLIASHFRSIFSINNRFYGYDDMKTELDSNIIKHVVSSCLYCISKD